MPFEGVKRRRQSDRGDQEKSLIVVSHYNFHTLTIACQFRSVADMDPVVQETQLPARSSRWHPPFNSETGRINGLKGASARQALREAQAELAKLPPVVNPLDEIHPLKARLTVLRYVQNRAWRKVIASNDVQDMIALAEIARVAFEHEQRLTKGERVTAAKVPKVSAPATTSAIEPIGAQPSTTGG